MTITTGKQQSGTLHDLLHDSGDAPDSSIPASGRTASDRNNTNITEAPCTDNEKIIEKKIDKAPSPRAGKRFGWRNKTEDAAKSGPDRMHPLLREGISIYISSQKRLPSGFGSVRYLGKGRKNAYAVHPPVKMIPGEKAIRPPALCYVLDRNSGFKVLSLYHAGLFQGGLERNPASLQARFSEMLAAIGMTAEEYPTGDLLLKARGTLPGSGGSSPEGGQSLQKPGDTLPKTSGSVLTFLEIILHACSAANGPLILPQESSVPNPTGNPVMNPELDRSFSEQHSAEYLKADHEKDKTYVDLLLNMSIDSRNL